METRLSDAIERKLRSLFLDSEFYDNQAELAEQVGKMSVMNRKWSINVRAIAAVAGFNAAARAMGLAFHDVTKSFAAVENGYESRIAELGGVLRGFEMSEEEHRRYSLVEIWPDWVDYNMPNWMWRGWEWLVWKCPKRILPKL